MTTPSSQASILIVEDDNFISTSYTDRLTKDGFTPFPAATTKAAEEILQTQSIHLILLDIMLPREDGLAFLKKIKKEESWQNIPVIVLSNLGDDATIAKARALGVVDYLVKAEQTPQSVVQKIQEHLELSA